MQITIDIPDELYETIKSDEYGVHQGRIYDIIRSGTPLSKEEPTDENLHREREQAYMQGYEDASKKFRQEPCEDAVSRQEVLEAFEEWINDREDWNEHPVRFTRSLVSLPSVTPARKKGEWIKRNNDYFDWYECSECGYGSEGEMRYSREYDVRTNYCPKCGAEMESEKK